MAKKKKYRRSRKMGALNPGSTVMKLAAVAAGYLLADQINGAITSVVNKISPPATGVPTATGALGGSITNIVPFAEIGLGGMLLLKGKKTLIKTAAGGLLAGAGLKSVLKQMGVISGYQSTPVLAGRGVRGYQQVPVLGRMPAGIPGQLQGYGVNGTPAQLQGYVPNGSQKVMGATGDGGSGYRDN